jgi:hypothetical protein
VWGHFLSPAGLAKSNLVIFYPILETRRALKTRHVRM